MLRALSLTSRSMRIDGVDIHGPSIAIECCVSCLRTTTTLPLVVSSRMFVFNIVDVICVPLCRAKGKSQLFTGGICHRSSSTAEAVSCSRPSRLCTHEDERRHQVCLVSRSRVSRFSSCTHADMSAQEDTSTCGPRSSTSPRSAPHLPSLRSKLRPHAFIGSILECTSGWTVY